MEIVKNKQYLFSLELVSQLALPWERLRGKTVLISGASGMIGSFLVDLLMLKNRDSGLNCMISAVGRNEDRARERFRDYFHDDRFQFIRHDINQPLACWTDRLDYVIHLASNTHPVAYATAPVETIMTNIIGTKNMLDIAVKCHADRFLFASSVEVYGENRGDVEKFDEGYCGYLDCNTLRAGYPESKRCGEALCQAYRKKEGLDIVIARFARTYGPTMLPSDTKAISQFIKNGTEKKDIVLKSKGNQLYSYIYVADAVSGLLTILLNGADGEAYNIADKDSDITLKDLAELIALSVGTKVVSDLPTDMEREGYSKATKAIMDPSKLKNLGWKAHWNINNGIISTIRIMES